jgi:hypothetical protein
VGFKAERRLVDKAGDIEAGNIEAGSGSAEVTS